MHASSFPELEREHFLRRCEDAAANYQQKRWSKRARQEFLFCRFLCGILASAYTRLEWPGIHDTSKELNKI